MSFCKKCKIPVGDLGKHLRRNRCKALIERRNERGSTTISRSQRGANRK